MWKNEIFSRFRMIREIFSFDIGPIKYISRPTLTNIIMRADNLQFEFKTRTFNNLERTPYVLIENILIETF